MPRMKTSKTHVHQIQIRNVGKKKDKKVWACAAPDCTYFVYNGDLLKGKLSICNQCGEEFILTPDIISEKVVRPRCKDCRAAKRLGGPKPKINPVKIQEEQSLDNAIESLWGELLK